VCQNGRGVGTLSSSSDGKFIVRKSGTGHLQRKKKKGGRAPAERKIRNRQTRLLRSSGGLKRKRKKESLRSDYHQAKEKGKRPQSRTFRRGEKWEKGWPGTKTGICKGSLSVHGKNPRFFRSRGKEGQTFVNHSPPQGESVPVLHKWRGD